MLSLLASRRPKCLSLSEAASQVACLHIGALLGQSGTLVSVKAFPITRHSDANPLKLSPYRALKSKVVSSHTFLWAFQLKHCKRKCRIFQDKIRQGIDCKAFMLECHETRFMNARCASVRTHTMMIWLRSQDNMHVDLMRNDAVCSYGTNIMTYIFGFTSPTGSAKDSSKLFP